MAAGQEMSCAISIFLPPANAVQDSDVNVVQPILYLFLPNRLAQTVLVAPYWLAGSHGEPPISTISMFHGIRDLVDDIFNVL
jgi:hypothetical protein